MKYTDLVMLDIKHIDDEQHKILTGCTNENILDFAKYLDEIKNLSGFVMSLFRRGATMTERLENSVNSLTD